MNDEPAEVRQRGDRVEGLYGGLGAPDGDDHGHVASNDGYNVSYLREPGGKVVVDDKHPHDPYGGEGY